MVLGRRDPGKWPQDRAPGGGGRVTVRWLSVSSACQGLYICLYFYNDPMEELQLRSSFYKRGN